MRPQRERAVSEIFHAAVVRRGGDRDAFLTAACQVDPTLRADVEALIAAHEAATRHVDDVGGIAEAPDPAPADKFHAERPDQPPVPTAGITADQRGLNLPPPAVPRPEPAVAGSRPASSGDHRSLVMTLAWMVIGFAVLLIAAFGVLNWLRR